MAATAIGVGAAACRVEDAAAIPSFVVHGKAAKQFGSLVLWPNTDCKGNLRANSSSVGADKLVKNLNSGDLL
jgi:hypothetical protein